MFNSYQAIKVAGEGGSGRVFKVKSEEGQTYAVKCLDADKINREKLKRFKNENLLNLAKNHDTILLPRHYARGFRKAKKL